MRSASNMLALAALATAANAAIVEHWWNITYATANPDGLFERRVIGVNGTWPPPAVHSTTGDIIRIHATNGLGDANLGTALHSHGMFFNNTNWFDGAVGVTQCPIPSEETFTYDIDTSIQVGGTTLVLYTVLTDRAELSGFTVTTRDNMSMVSEPVSTARRITRTKSNSQPPSSTRSMALDEVTMSLGTTSGLWSSPIGTTGNTMTC